MFDQFKKFDIHTKAQEGVNQKTLIGALLTVITFFLVMGLLVTEITAFLKVDVASRMIVDNTKEVDTIEIDFSIVYPSIPCDKLTFTQEITKGTLHMQLNPDVSKTPLQDGCSVKGIVKTEKIGGNLLFAIPESENFDLSHRVEYLNFESSRGPSAQSKLPDVPPYWKNSLVSAPESTVIYQHTVQVVPTQYKTLFGDLSFLNQYSVHEKAVSAEALTRNELSISLRGFHGVLFTYDFYPVTIIIIFALFYSLYVIFFL